MPEICSVTILERKLTQEVSKIAMDEAWRCWSNNLPLNYGGRVYKIVSLTSNLGEDGKQYHSIVLDDLIATVEEIKKTIT